MSTIPEGKMLRLALSPDLRNGHAKEAGVSTGSDKGANPGAHVTSRKGNKHYSAMCTI